MINLMGQFESRGDVPPYQKQLESLSISLTEAHKALADKTAECEALKDKLNQAQDEIERLTLDVELANRK